MTEGWRLPSPHDAPPHTDPDAACESDAHLQEAIEAFLLSRQVGNCTARTVGFYRDCLARFARFPGAALRCGDLVIQRYLTHLHASMRPVSAHAHYRALKVFFGWCVEAGLWDHRRGPAEPGARGAPRRQRPAHQRGTPAPHRKRAVR